MQYAYSDFCDVTWLKGHGKSSFTWRIRYNCWQCYWQRGTLLISEPFNQNIYQRVLGLVRKYLTCQKEVI